jgi:hypothetical protein
MHCYHSCAVLPQLPLHALPNQANVSGILTSVCQDSICCLYRNLTAAMGSWGSQVQGTQQQPSSAAAPVTTAATAKGVNLAVASVATMHNDKCKPAHEAAVEASQAVDGVRSALTAYLRQGRKPQDRMPDLFALGPAELKSPGGSYRCVLTLVLPPLWGVH